MARKRATFIPPFSPAPVTQDWQLLFKQTLSSTSHLLDTGVNGIPATKEHLRVTVVGNTNDGSIANDTCIFWFNGDTGNTYDAQVITATGAALAGASALNSSISCVFGSAVFSGNAARPSYLYLDMFEYANTTWWKTGQFFNGYLTQNAPNFLMGSVWWQNTAAINQFTMQATAGVGTSFNPGTVLSVFGY